MIRRQNKLRNDAGLIGLSFLDINIELLKSRILVAVQDLLENQFLYAKVQYFSAPPLSASFPSLRLLWRRH